jgi:ABC-2 type transport system ATP-binding protein
MIEVRGLNKYYNGYHALKGIDLNVGKGEIYGFIGHNGAGKSTTINILAGLSKPQSGECIVNGRNIRNIKHPGELGIGYLPEEPRFYPWLTAYETLEYLGRGNGHDPSRKDIMELLEWVGLKDAAHRRVGGFSRGMRQRLGIGAALVHDPDLLFFDEPSSALDPEGRSGVLALIRDLKLRGKTVFFSTHILDDVERICDRVGMLVKGKIVLEKPLEALLKENLSPVFDIELCNDDDSVTEGVERIEGVTEAAMKDGRLTVTVMDARRDSVKLLSFLADHNVPVLSFTLRKSSLEDIFIKELNH